MYYENKRDYIDEKKNNYWHAHDGKKIYDNCCRDKDDCDCDCECDCDCDRHKNQCKVCPTGATGSTGTTGATGVTGPGTGVTTPGLLTVPAFID